MKGLQSLSGNQKGKTDGRAACPFGAGPSRSATERSWKQRAGAELAVLLPPSRCCQLLASTATTARSSGREICTLLPLARWPSKWCLGTVLQVFHSCSLFFNRFLVCTRADLHETQSLSIPCVTFFATGVYYNEEKMTFN